MTYHDVGAYFRETHYSQVVLGLVCANTDYAGQRRITLNQGIAMSSNAYVARAHDSKHGEVAIKFSHPAVIDKEYAILSRLKDAGVAGVAHVYGYCHSNPFRAITLQLFTSSLAACGTMELGTVVAMGKGMVSTLQAVHDLGIIHNDIKPGNIVTSDRQNFYLIDWDAASYKADLAPTRRIGTPLYMSVRTLEGNPGNKQDDLESLLYTMVHLLYHDLPWLSEKSTTASEYISLAQKKRVFHVRQLSRSCPDAFQDFLNICREDHGDFGGSDYTNLISILETLL